MQAQILYKLEIVHISSGNRICKHRSYTSQKMCTYPTGIEHTGTSYRIHAQIL